MRSRLSSFGPRCQNAVVEIKEMSGNKNVSCKVHIAIFPDFDFAIRRDMFGNRMRVTPRSKDFIFCHSNHNFAFQNCLFVVWGQVGIAFYKILAGFLKLLLKSNTTTANQTENYYQILHHCNFKMSILEVSSA